MRLVTFLLHEWIFPRFYWLHKNVCRNAVPDLFPFRWMKLYCDIFMSSSFEPAKHKLCAGENYHNFKLYACRKRMTIFWSVYKVQRPNTYFSHSSKCEHCVVWKALDKYGYRKLIRSNIAWTHKLGKTAFEMFTFTYVFRKISN